MRQEKPFYSLPHGSGQNLLFLHTAHLILPDWGNLIWQGWWPDPTKDKSSGSCIMAASRGEGAEAQKGAAV